MFIFKEATEMVLLYYIIMNLRFYSHIHQWHDYVNVWNSIYKSSIDFNHKAMHAIIELTCTRVMFQFAIWKFNEVNLIQFSEISGNDFGNNRDLLHKSKATSRPCQIHRCQGNYWSMATEYLVNESCTICSKMKRQYNSELLLLADDR